MEAGLVQRPIQPLGTGLANAGTGTATVTFTSTQDINAPFVSVSNASAVLAYMSIGGTATVAIATVGLNATPIPASTTLLFYKGNAATLNFITAANTATILATASKGY